MQEKLFTLQNLNTQWRQVLSYGQTCTVNAGSILNGVYKDEKVFYFILSGTVQSLYAALDGRERIAVQFSKNCLFAVPRCFAENSDPRLHNMEEHLSFFRCNSKVDLVIFPARLLRDIIFIQKNPDLIINTMQSMGTVILSLFDMLTRMHLPDLRGKLARFILDLYETHNNTHIVPSVTQHELANLFGVHRGSLARAIKELRDEGIISGFTKNKLIIHDISALQAVLDEK